MTYQKMLELKLTWMKWAEHMVRMTDGRLPKRSEGEEKWREKANNREKWSNITEVTKVAEHRSDK